MKIGISSDHGGYILKSKIIKYLKIKYEVIDCGTNSIDSVDYPEYAFKLGELVANNELDLGIILCKTGIGVSIAANKVKGVRCAKIDNINDSKCAKIHNNANMISFGGNISFFKAKRLINTFLSYSSSKEKRHIRRVNKIKEYENEH